MAHVSTVITGLEACNKQKCKICPYYTAGNENPYHCMELLHDVLEQLKKHRNKVLTLEEVAYSDHVYLEYAPNILVNNQVELAIVNTSTLQMQDQLSFYLQDAGKYDYRETFFKKDYNVKYRCWRYKPTFYESKNTPWRIPC